MPVPGGPYSKIPLEGAYKPEKISGLKAGKTIVSFSIFFTSAKPLISSHLTFGFPSSTDYIIYSLTVGSILLLVSSVFFSSSLFSLDYGYYYPGTLEFGAGGKLSSYLRSFSASWSYVSWLTKAFLRS